MSSLGPMSQRPPRFRRPQRRPQGGGRGDAPARAGAAGRGRADRLRSHRHPAPVAAAHLAPSQAAGRGRPGRALPRGHLGLLPPGRARRRRRAGARAARRGSIRPTRPSRATAPGSPRCGRRAPPRRRPISARTPPSGTASASCTSPTTAVEAAIRAALADKPFRSLLDLGTGTGRMLELFGAEIERGLGLDLSLDMLLLARDRLERAGLQALQRAAGRHLRSAARQRFLRRRHPASGAALPRRRRARHQRGGARAAPGRAAAGGRLRAARAGIPARAVRPSPARLCAGDGDAMDDARPGSSRCCTESLAPEPGSDGKIAVSLWLARDARALMAAAAQREVA